MPITPYEASILTKKEIGKIKQCVEEIDIKLREEFTPNNKITIHFSIAISLRIASYLQTLYQAYGWSLNVSPEADSYIMHMQASNVTHMRMKHLDWNSSQSDTVTPQRTNYKFEHLKDLEIGDKDG